MHNRWAPISRFEKHYCINASIAIEHQQRATENNDMACRHQAEWHTCIMVSCMTWLQASSTERSIFNILWQHSLAKQALMMTSPTPLTLQATPGLQNIAGQIQSAMTKERRVQSWNPSEWLYHVACKWVLHQQHHWSTQDSPTCPGQDQQPNTHRHTWQPPPPFLASSWLCPRKTPRHPHALR